MKASGRNDTEVVDFTGKMQRIARVHQLGLTDRPKPNSQCIQYSERQLLVFTQADKQLIGELFEKYVVQSFQFNHA